MSQESIDAFFDLAHDDREVPADVERDRWGRPLIIQPDGSKKAYTRASSLAGYIENTSGLEKWKRRMLTRGMGLREDLAAMAAALPALTGDKKKDAITNAALDEYAEAAHVAADGYLAANYGTAVHGFTEPGMKGHPHIPERMQADVQSFWDVLELYGIRQVASECFVVNDRLRIAGTFDDLFWSPAYGLTIGDKKTGKRNLHKTLTQLAAYDDSVLYDWETGERRPIESLAGGNLTLNHAVALYVHIPAGEGRTEIYEMDLELGRRAMEHAAWVRDFHSQREGIVTPAHNRLLDGVRRQEVWELIMGATTREELIAIAQQYRDVWTDELTALGNSRL